MHPTAVTGGRGGTLAPQPGLPPAPGIRHVPYTPGAFSSRPNEPGTGTKRRTQSEADEGQEVEEIEEDEEEYDEEYDDDDDDDDDGGSRDRGGAPSPDSDDSYIP
ncbi:hypothetical protein SLS64_004628 [Diaporthe eres]